MGIMEQAEFWHWWVAAAILFIIEVLLPASFFLWFGLAASLVGFILLAVPELAWEYQLLSFSLISVVSMVAFRRYFALNPIKTDQPKLNRRGEQYVGRNFTLTEPIVNGFGKIKVDDTTWKIEGADCDAGNKVIVTGVDGVVLQVEPNPE